MQFQRITAAILLVFIAAFMAPGNAATKQKKTAPKAATAPWAPSPYPSGASTLPLGYTGLDIKKVWRLFKSKSQNFEKSEFETTDEFQQRLANSAAALSPLLPDSEYALLLTSLSPKYNADTQQYEVTDYTFCQKAYDFGETKGWATCNIGELERQRSEYVGSNAYGAKASIDKTTGKDFAIAVPADSGFLFSSLFERDKYSQYSSIFKLTGNFFLPIEKAKSLQQYKIGVLLVGKFTMAKIIDGKATLIDPTITKPRDIFISVDAVPFSPTRVVYYVMQTGEILSSQSL